MRVQVCHQDAALAQRVMQTIYPVCAVLADVPPPWDLCKLSLTHGVFIFELWAKDGVYGKQPIGERAIALLVAKWQSQDRQPLKDAMAFLLRRVKKQHDAQRRRRTGAYAVRNSLIVLNEGASYATDVD